MERFEERIKKNKRRKIIYRVMLSLGFISLFFVSFYIGGKISESKSVLANANMNKPNVNEVALEKQVEKKEEQVSKESDNPNYLSKIEAVNPYKKDGVKIAYLTFDDGPSVAVTPRVLDTLKKYNIKATFFVIGSMANGNKELIKREAEEGHKVANHTYSHNYKQIYSNPKLLVEDFNKCNVTLKSILGDKYNNKLVRFPGGAIGKKLEPYRQAVKEAGYSYIDWNDLTGDANERHVPVDRLLSNLKNNTAGNEDVVVLMHDAPEKVTTADALPQVIEYLKSEGFSFQVLQ